MARYLLLMLALALAGCAVTPSADSPNTTVPVGAQLVLVEPLTIPARKVSTYLQDGRAMNYRTVNRYYPHCKFELWKLADVPRTVAPDTFTVTRVVRDTWLVRAPTPRRLAAAGVSAGFGDDSGGPSWVEMSTILYLDSERQPDVYRLTCSQWDDPRLPEHLTINEIRTALGSLIRLERLGDLNE